jgi:hypothetical protein
MEHEDGAPFEDPNDAPTAIATSYYKCGGCDNLHVMLVDENDDTWAKCVIGRDMLLHMLETIDGEPAKDMPVH